MHNLVAKFKKWLFYLEYKKTLTKDSDDKTKTVAVGKGSLLSVEVYDVLDNKQFNKLMRQIAKLDKSKFDTKLNYKRNKFKNRNYIRPQFDNRSTASVARINPKGDGFISEIDIAWTQINNDEAVIEYSFSFAKAVSSLADCKVQILKYWNLIMSVETLPYYKSVDTILVHDEGNDEHIYKMFLSIFQGFINKHLYTNLGHRHQLPINVSQLSKTSRSINELIKNKHLFVSIYKSQKDSTFLIHNPIDDWVIHTVAVGKSYSRDSLLGYFSQYGMNYYYYIFGKIEISELSSKLTDYLNSGKTKLSLSSRKWLFKKFRRVSEVKLFPRDDWKIEDVTGVSKDVKGLKYGGVNLAKRFRDVYEDNLKYANSVFNLTDVHIWVWVVLIISMLGLTATVFQFFFPSMEDLAKYLSPK